MTGISAGKKIISQVCFSKSASGLPTSQPLCADLQRRFPGLFSSPSESVFGAGLKEPAFEQLPRWHSQVEGLRSRSFRASV